MLAQSTPDNSNLQGPIYQKFELQGIKLHRKWPEGKWKLLRVSGRFEFARVRAIGYQLYCNCCHCCLPVKMASKIVIRPSILEPRKTTFYYYFFYKLHAKPVLHVLRNLTCQYFFAVSQNSAIVSPSSSARIFRMDYWNYGKAGSTPCVFR